MTDPLSCSYEQAALNHLRDALALTTEQRWEWFCEQVARQRAAQGLPTLSASGKILWSPELAREWEARAAGARAVEP